VALILSRRGLAGADLDTPLRKDAIIDKTKNSSAQVAVFGAHGCRF